LFTWLYDAHGNAAAILDEFCIRSVAGEPVAWVFGLSVFSLKGEHIGWFEDGIFFDVDNKILGFIPAAGGVHPDFPEPGAPPPVPPLPKRPHVPTLRARPVRQISSGWSPHGLADYFEGAAALPPAPFMPGASGGDRSAMNDIPR